MSLSDLLDSGQTLMQLEDELNAPARPTTRSRRTSTAAASSASAGLAEDDSDSEPELDYATSATAEARRAKVVTALLSSQGRGAAPKERTEEMPEGEHNLRGSGRQLSVNDLLATLDDSASFGGVKKQLAQLSREQATLAKPVDMAVSARAERKVAYKEVTKELGKWVPAVKAHREADTLSFPLNDPSVGIGQSTASLASKFTPSTALESSISAILDSSAAVEQPRAQLSAEEQAALKSMSAEEARARRKQLQKMRALQSYYEAKCKRMKKIKSKKYRKILKKVEKRTKSVGETPPRQHTYYSIPPPPLTPDSTLEQGEERGTGTRVDGPGGGRARSLKGRAQACAGMSQQHPADIPSKPPSLDPDPSLLPPTTNRPA